MSFKREHLSNNPLLEDRNRELVLFHSGEDFFHGLDLLLGDSGFQKILHLLF
jgi:hypothetical protein